MKVDNIQAIQNVLIQQLTQQLKQGDVVMSEVVKAQDNTAQLRTAQGTLLTASLVGNLNLLPGDHVETVVVEASPGRFVLQVMDIIRADPASLEFGRTQNTTQYFQPQTLHSALSMLKMNTGLPPKAAEFMARNGIAATPENVTTLAQLAGGGPRMAQVLTQMTTDVMLVMPESTVEAGIAPIPTGVSVAAEQDKNDSPGTTPQDTAAQEQSSMPAGTSGQSSPAASQPANTAAPAASLQNTAAQGEASMPAGTLDAPAPTIPLPTDTANPAVPADAAQVNGTDPPLGASGQAEAAAPPPGTAVQDDMPAPHPDSLSSEIRETNRPAVPSIAPPLAEAGSGIREPAVLLQRLVSLFVDLKDKDNLPVRLRNAANELPAQVKELKNALMNTDSNSSNTLARQAELLDRQQSMMADIKRFNCYHIPLTTAHGSPSTAELYVYRQRHRKKEAAPDSYAVLIGLDTQHMGRVETMIRARGRSVALEFRLEQASLAAAFEDSAKDLAPAIAQAGYHLSDVRASSLTAKTTVLNAEEVLAEGQRTSDTGGMDIRI